VEERTISNIEGNLQGLKPNQIRRLEKLYQRRIPPRQIVTQEFARQLSEASHEIHRQVGVLVNRNGYVEHVVVGNARSIVLPDLKRVRMGADRFRGLRCLHTHLAGEGLTQDDLTDLALLRLDLMAAIDVRSDGMPGVVRAAHLLPANGQPSRQVTSDLDEAMEGAEPTAMWVFLEPQVPSQIDTDFVDLIESLEEELARARHVRNPRDHRDRAILVGVTTGSAASVQESLEELRELARSAGVVVLDSIIQRRQKLDPRSLVGRGKLDELIIRSLQLGADLIIFDQNLSPAQVRAINEATDLKIIDRTQLILDIFAQRAQSREGKIQVELAQLKYMLPRLSGSGIEMSRLMGGIGGRGPGETKLEVDRRRVRDRIHLLEKQIEQIRTSRRVQRTRRTRRDLPIISIVGYTNAGKSTLLNALTTSTVTAEDRMFATLDPTSRRLRLPRRCRLTRKCRLPRPMVLSGRTDVINPASTSTFPDPSGARDEIDRGAVDVGRSDGDRLLAARGIGALEAAEGERSPFDGKLAGLRRRVEDVAPAGGESAAIDLQSESRLIVGRVLREPGHCDRPRSGSCDVRTDRKPVAPSNALQSHRK